MAEYTIKSNEEPQFCSSFSYVVIGSTACAKCQYNAVHQSITSNIEKPETYTYSYTYKDNYDYEYTYTYSYITNPGFVETKVYCIK